MATSIAEAVVCLPIRSMAAVSSPECWRTHNHNNPHPTAVIQATQQKKHALIRVTAGGVRPESQMTQITLQCVDTVNNAMYTDTREGQIGLSTSSGYGAWK